MVNVTIDGKTIQVPEGTTVLRAAEQAGISIPVLCDHPHLVPFGGCRLCVVEVEGMRTMQPSCSLPVSNNMVVRTDTDKVLAARKFILTPHLQRPKSFLPLLPGLRRRLRITKCRSRPGHDPLGLPAQLEALRRRCFAPSSGHRPQPLHPLPALRARVRRAGRQLHSGDRRTRR